jgi:hypothetical protein
MPSLTDMRPHTCSFVPIFNENGEHSTFMQIYHSQTPISLMKKNTAQVLDST